MPGPQQQQQNSGGDNALDFLWIIAIVVVSIGLIWYFGKNYIADAVYQIKLYEIIGIRFVLKGWNDFASLLSLPMLNLNKLYTLEMLIRSHQLDSSFKTVQSVSTSVGHYLSFPAAIILGILGFLVYFKNVSLKFKNIFSMKRLKLQERADWPQITPIVNVDLIHQDLDEGSWAMSMTPIQFCKKHNLIKEERDEDDKVSAKLIRGAAHNVFVLQLGPLWTRIEAYPIHVQALFAIFAAYANQDREQADKLFKQISASSLSNKIDFSDAMPLLQKYKNTKLVQRVLHLHAYMLTVMASMLELARTDGVVACSEFLWLKSLDRRLWYMLNSVGRQTVFAEVAGPFGHWITEKKLGRALKHPMVEEAVNGLEQALSDILYIPEEEQ